MRDREVDGWAGWWLRRSLLGDCGVERLQSWRERQLDTREKIIISQLN